MNDHSHLMYRSIGVIFPVILLFGLYVIFNGHVSPGGGFQGGAVLSSVLIAKYLGNPTPEFDLDRIQTVEKTALLMLMILATLFLTLRVYAVIFHDLVTFFLISNTLIGLKVACGLTIIFYRFAFYESR